MILRLLTYALPLSHSLLDLSPLPLFRQITHSRLLLWATFSVLRTTHDLLRPRSFTLLMVVLIVSHALHSWNQYSEFRRSCSNFGLGFPMEPLLIGFIQNDNMLLAKINYPVTLSAYVENPHKQYHHSMDCFMYWLSLLHLNLLQRL